jgi:hypothetical protein
MGCGCNKKKENKDLISRAQDKIKSKNVNSQQNQAKLPIVSTVKKTVIKPKK